MPQLLKVVRGYHAHLSCCSCGRQEHDVEQPKGWYECSDTSGNCFRICKACVAKQLRNRRRPRR